MLALRENKRECDMLVVINTENDKLIDATHSLGGPSCAPHWEPGPNMLTLWPHLQGTHSQV